MIWADITGKGGIGYGSNHASNVNTLYLGGHVKGHPLKAADGESWMNHWPRLPMALDEISK